MLTGAERSGIDDAATDSRAADLLADALDLRSHARIAHVVAARNLDQLLHVAGVGWFCWDGKRFVRDLEDKRVTATIVAAIRELAPEALANKDLLADLKQAQTANGIAGVARIMAALEGIRAGVEDLDVDPLLLNLANGVLDLRELDSLDGRPTDWRQMTLRPHHPKYRMTQITKAAFNPDADDSVFRAFLDRSLPDVEVRGFLQLVLGAGLLGEQVVHVLLILEGAGRNGKGVLYGAAHFALGSYSYVAPSSLFDLTKGDPNRPAPAFLELRGKRLVWMSETAKAAVMDSALIKRLTGGDPITGRYLHKNDAVSFNPSHQLVLITNDAPRLPADDPAVWARVKRIPWDVEIPDDEQDPALPAKLQNEVDAVLGWLLAGLAAYRVQGLDEPSRVREATAEYRAEQDTVARFIENRCDQCDSSDGSGLKELYIAYGGFCRGDGVLPDHVLKERDFANRLESLGFPRAKGTGGRRFRAGLLLLPSDQEARAAEQSAAITRRIIATDAADRGDLAATTGAVIDRVVDHARKDGLLVEGRLDPIGSPWEFGAAGIQRTDISDGRAS